MFSLNVMVIGEVIDTPVASLVGEVEDTVGGIVSMVYVCVYIGDVLPARSIAKYFSMVFVFIVIGSVYMLLDVVGVVPSVV